MKDIIQVRVNIKGRVQGVFFRASTRDAALAAGVQGYVKNLEDGSVEAVFQGTKAQVNQMVDWCHKGSPLSSVSSVDTTPCTVHSDYSAFSITY